jgi:DNA-binding response OmpR family regulator
MHIFAKQSFLGILVANTGYTIAYEPLTQGSELESELATILVLDEDTDSCLLLKRVLQQMGHKVFAFRNGREAAEWAASNIPDLGIVNIRKRSSRGFPFFGRLKHVNRDLKVMVITDAFSEELSEKWLADDVVVKPLDIDQVEIKVRRLLGSQRAVNQPSGKGVKP